MRSGESPLEEVRRRDRPLRLVRPHAHPLTKSLHILRTDLQDIVRAGIAACDAGALVTRSLVGGDPGGAIRIIAAGKAAPAMARAACDAFGERVAGGMVAAPRGPAVVDSRLQWFDAGHPVPTIESERAGRRALDIARTADSRDTILFLWSGGASAMLVAPAGRVTLDDKQQTTAQLLRAGADIHALNTVRKHLSAIKGGRLAAAASTHWRTLAISDVVGDDLSVIASGPTVADASTFQDALDVLGRHGGLDAFPSRVVTELGNGAGGALDETPKPGDARLSRGDASVIGSRATAMDGAARAAAARGYEVVRLERAIVGEAREAAAAYLASIASVVAARPAHGPLCIVSSGETTVRVTGRGKGGRNQEFGLALVDRLVELGAPAALASVGTDGVDGPTDAAGAVLDTDSALRARERQLEPSRFLHDNDAYAFFSALDDLVRTGPTGTNVGDLQVLLLH